MKPRRIAMWSGPRNISTAFMRAFENRPDTWVCDEPFYAHYLLQTGVAHPGREEVIASQETDCTAVINALLGPVPRGRHIYYQKHMSHHLLPGMGRDWLDSVTNCFLIRDPAAMVVSLDAKYANPTLADTGLPQQREIFDRVVGNTGRIPPVIDAQDLLRNPRALITAFCHAVGIPFMDCMLTWPTGPRPTDGVWGKHWYDAVWKSTGFNEPIEKPVSVPRRLRPLQEACLQHYYALHQYRLTG